MGVIFASLLGLEAVKTKERGIKPSFLRENARGSLQNEAASETGILNEAKYAKTLKPVIISIVTGALAPSFTAGGKTVHKGTDISNQAIAAVTGSVPKSCALG